MAGRPVAMGALRFAVWDMERRCAPRASRSAADAKVTFRAFGPLEVDRAKESSCSLEVVFQREERLSELTSPHPWVVLVFD